MRSFRTLLPFELQTESVSKLSALQSNSKVVRDAAVAAKRLSPDLILMPPLIHFNLKRKLATGFRAVWTIFVTEVVYLARM